MKCCANCQKELPPDYQELPEHFTCFCGDCCKKIDADDRLHFAALLMAARDASLLNGPGADMPFNYLHRVVLPDEDKWVNVNINVTFGHPEMKTTKVE